MNDSFALKADIKRILIHPDWNSLVPTYDGDIALLKTKTVISFTDYIQPVCLPTADSTIFNVNGIVIGNSKSDELSNKTRSRIIEVKSVGEDVCLSSNPALVSLISPRMFCAVGQVKTPCK